MSETARQFVMREQHRTHLTESEWHTCADGHQLEGTVAVCSRCGFEYCALFVEPADCMKCQTRNTVRRLTCHVQERRTQP
jgi:predicted Zn-ribbon and HTH transcriptional regulator